MLPPFFPGGKKVKSATGISELSRSIVIIPTYNEAESLPVLIPEILDCAAGIEVLIVDDNSPDGTGDLADRLAKNYPEVSVLHRPEKRGIGPAYRAGFRRALEDGYDFIVQMDADRSHDPAQLPVFLELIGESDMVIGSRYIPGGAVVNWGFHRRILSRMANIYARAVTGMPYRDSTSGFTCFRRSILESLSPESVQATGYSFQIEFKYRVHHAGFRIRETPITFRERSRGRSKMNRHTILEAMWRVWSLRFLP